MRGPTTIGASSMRSDNSNGALSSASPLCVPVIPRAWHTRPGPAQSSRASCSRRLRRIAGQSLDHTENIQVEFMRLSEIPARIASGEFCQGLHIATLQLALQHLPPDYV